MAGWYRLSMMALMVLVVWGCSKKSALEGQKVDGQGQTVAAAEPLPKRFTKADNGVITDRVSGLDWYLGPSQHNTWRQAKAWTENLTVAGGGWRMPTRAELKGIYQKGAAANHMDPLFQTVSVWVWSGELKDPAFAWGLAFYNGQEGWHSVDYGYGRLAFAVRSRR
jgi:hypothetical protein